MFRDKGRCGEQILEDMLMGRRGDRVCVSDGVGGESGREVGKRGPVRGIRRRRENGEN